MIDLAPGLTVADTGPSLVQPASTGKPVAFLPNHLDIPGSVVRIVAALTQEFRFPALATPQIRNAPRILHHCADADEFLKAMIWLDEAFKPEIPIFNPPRGRVDPAGSWFAPSE